MKQETTGYEADPQFIREREAWFRAGAGAMASVAFVATLTVGVLVGLASLLFGLAPYTVLWVCVAATWASQAIGHFYLGATARRTARRGGVDVDRF